MNISNKIKAGALQYVLVISVIIAIIIFAFISLVYLQQRLTIKHNFAKEAISNTQMAFEYIKHKEIPYDIETTIELTENENTTTQIIKKHWGIFDVGIATSKVSNEYFQKVALLGTQNSQRDALYLNDNNASLVLVGNTKIIGNVSIPKQGVKTGNISGISFYGNQLIDGQQKTSTNELPTIRNIEFLKDFYHNYNNENNTFFELEEGLQIHQSHTQNTLLFEDNNSILLKNISLNGNILIVSKKEITIQSSAKLQDVILMAPKIVIEENVNGNFQVIATKQIDIQSNVYLKYPTAIILLDQDNEIQQNNLHKQEEKYIKIQPKSEIRGVIIYDSENPQTNFIAQIEIAEESKIIGEVYCSKNLELQGIVFGTVYTHNFIIKKAGGIYVNHLYDGEINSKKLPLQYAGLQINQSSNQVAKWIE